MRSLSIIAVSALIGLASCATAHRNAAVTTGELNQLVSALASDTYKGRGTGSGYDTAAAAYIRNEFKKSGLKPFTGDGLQRFTVNVSAEAGKNNRFKTSSSDFTQGTDFVPVAFSSNDSLKAEVVFCGYGFMVSNDSLNWNDYGATDVKGKWVLILRGFPESNPAAAAYNAFSSDRMKVLNARENGAAGVLLVSGDNWDAADNLDRPSRGESSSGIPVLQVKRGVADNILKGSGKTVKELESEAAEMKPISFATGAVADGRAEILAKSALTSNVAMMIGSRSNSKEYVIVGAHYDHLGMGGPGSGSRAVDTVAVHYGADDNASGVAMMVELAGKLAAEKNGFDRNIIFVAFSGEELGLLGSKHFVENMGIMPAEVNLMVNLDMVGRMKEGNGLQVGGVGTAAGLRDTVIAYADTTRLSLAFTEEGYGPSDHSSFYGKNIPVLVLTTGAHLDYHTPSDTPDKINYEGMVSISDLLYDIVKAAANDTARLAYREAGPKGPSQPGGRRRGVTLGIMPDFAGNVKNGLRADFVTPGKPAALGGMVKGDVIVAIENKPVNNIEDYMFRLSQLKPGQTITVEVLRDGKRELLLIQL